MTYNIVKMFLHWGQMKRAYYSAYLKDFQNQTITHILGELTSSSEFPVENMQRNAWIEEIKILKKALANKNGKVYLEFSIPRMGKRADALIIINALIFVIEFKVGESHFLQSAIDQTWDYALDLKYFHETSHGKFIVPILVSTDSLATFSDIPFNVNNDKVFEPIKSSTQLLPTLIDEILEIYNSDLSIDASIWECGSYRPTPTIIEAAMALYSGHSVEEISRNDAGAINLSTTSTTISKIIEQSKQFSEKSICFVTGVPGAGKTLVGLNIATKYIDKNQDLFSVFLSGNGPLVMILREALARNKVQRQKELGEKTKLADARREVKLFIQNIHNFRDDCLIDFTKPPIEHVALFDEAQRAWNIEQTSNFMKKKKGINNFAQSEPEYLISCLDRHPDWAVIVCLVGGGQEINTGEAGLSEWIKAVFNHYTNWRVYLSPKLTDSEYGINEELSFTDQRRNFYFDEGLHLASSLRSFRNENVSLLVKQILDIDKNAAKITASSIINSYPIYLTRNLNTAKNWLKQIARGTERYGIVVSSQALRLKPLAVDVKTTVDPIHWFLDTKEDVRSSYYLEDVATEFQIQGLELDWACVVWDGDFRFADDHWEYRSFCGSKWTVIRNEERKKYLKNAYRVLLTRARQGMVIVVPSGDSDDPTRKSEFYDPVFSYLRELGIPVI